MALLWTDGLDRYGATADLSFSYNTITSATFSATGGKNGGGAISLSGTGGNIKRTFTTAGTLTAGNAVHFCGWWKSNGNAGGPFFSVGTNVIASDGSNSARVIINTDGSLSIKIHGSTSVAATSAAGVMPVGTFVHFEYAAKFNTTGGYIKVWINGVLVIDFSGATVPTTVPATYTEFFLASAAGGSSQIWDDLIAWDETGTDFALTQMTTAYLPVIETLSPNANDAVQFTPSTGSNFQNVDDPAFHNGDTDYNSSSTVGQADQFALADQATTPAYTFGVTLKTVAKIDIAGTIKLRTRLVSGGTTTDSADRTLTTSYALYADYFGKDPATTAVWTTTQANNLKCGYKYQS